MSPNELSWANAGQMFQSVDHDLGEETGARLDSQTGLRARTAAGKESGLQAQPFGDRLLPIELSERTIATDGAAQRFQFGIRLGRVDIVDPASRSRKWPTGQ